MPPPRLPKRARIDSAAAVDYTDAETEFMKAMDRYKRENRRPFPTWSEALQVALSLGYRKVEAAGPLPGAK
ncbi:hypothetical protein VT84_09240 [Gemmata sp. SH-PL17]|uniref:hypothetical protein n=1 Tax=Gemmata sp. SH-PL17 TaxID=1630693 RepID=UPI00078C8A46|nr:hypothetical protein [Gemmata sp. SH-PL17]AMV24567.1 hypothetical protein VT84_09240 [Gemmata sp. SH-PL17]